MSICTTSFSISDYLRIRTTTSPSPTRTQHRPQQLVRTTSLHQQPRPVRTTSLRQQQLLVRTSSLRLRLVFSSRRSEPQVGPPHAAGSPPRAYSHDVTWGFLPYQTVPTGNARCQGGWASIRHHKQHSGRRPVHIEVPQRSEKTRIYYSDTTDQEQEHGANSPQDRTTRRCARGAPGAKLLGSNHSRKPIRSTPTLLQSTAVHHV